MNKVEKYINNLSSVDGKLVIVIGANSGIGYAASEILLSKNAHLLFACRSQERMETAKQSLLKKYPEAKIDCLAYDQSSRQSIDDFVNIIKTNYSHFYALICNAGIYRPKTDKKYEDKLPLTFGTNYLGLFYLINKLKPFLDETKDEKRIIIQSSIASRFNKYKDKDIYKNEMSLTKQYNLSKLGTTCVYYYFHTNNSNVHVKYLLAEPGVTNTKLFSTYPKVIYKLGGWLMNVFTHSNQSAALPIVTLTVEEAKDGDYYRPKRLAIAGLAKKITFHKKWYSERMILNAQEYFKHD